MRKKVSKRKQQGTELPLGECFVCKQPHYRHESTWVITMNDRLLCEPMRKDCFDRQQDITENSTKEESTLTVKSKYDTDGAIYSGIANQPTKTNYRNKDQIFEIKSKLYKCYKAESDFKRLLKKFRYIPKKEFAGDNECYLPQDNFAEILNKNMQKHFRKKLSSKGLNIIAKKFN